MITLVAGFWASTAQASCLGLKNFTGSPGDIIKENNSSCGWEVGKVKSSREATKPVNELRRSNDKLL